MILPRKGLLGAKFGLITTFFFTYGMVYIAVMIPKILAVRGCTSAQIGELKAIGCAVVIIAPFLYALFSQKINNRRLAVQIGIFIFGGACIILFAKMGYLGYAVFMFIEGFFQNGTTNQLDSLALNTIEDSSTYGRIRVCGSIGVVLTILTTGYIADLFGFLNIVWFVMAIQAVLIILIFFLPSDTPSQEEKEKIDETKITLEQSTEKFPITASFVLLITFTVLKFMSQGSFNDFFIIYLTDNLHYTNSFMSIIVAIGIASEMAGLVFAVFLFKYFSIGTLLLATGLACALRWFMQGWGGHYTIILMMSQFLHIFTFSIPHICVLTYIKANFKNLKHASTAMGIYGSASLGLGSIIGSLIAGYTWDLGPHVAYGIDIALAVISGFFGLMVKSKASMIKEKKKV